jgi:hypothetical protein
MHSYTHLAPWSLKPLETPVGMYVAFVVHALLVHHLPPSLLAKWLYMSTCTTFSIGGNISTFFYISAVSRMDIVIQGYLGPECKTCKASNVGML